MREYRWVPGQGMDPAALARLRDHFRCPKEAMGEAWFMGVERKMFPELKGDLDRILVGDIQRALAEIAAGHGAFGPMDEWHDWYHYLLPRILPRGLEGGCYSVIETLVTCFIAVYPNGVRVAPYKTFREDTLKTIGRCLMEPQCWNGHEIVIGEVLHRSNCNPNRIWGWWDASGDFAACMMFSLKYLPADLVPGWLRSVLAIQSPHWRASFIVWAVGMYDVLENRTKWPSEWDVQAKSSVDWDWSHCLSAEIASRDAEAAGIQPMDNVLPLDTRENTLHLLRLYFTDDVFLEWLESISRVDYLQEESGVITSAFEELYVTRPDSPRIILDCR